LNEIVREPEMAQYAQNTLHGQLVDKKKSVHAWYQKNFRLPHIVRDSLVHLTRNANQRTGVPAVHCYTG